MSLQFESLIQEQFSQVDSKTEPLNLQDLAGTIRHACHTHNDKALTDIEENWLLMEILPLQLFGGESSRDNPWDSYFKPVSSMRLSDGSLTHIPNPFVAEKDHVDKWKKLARSLKHPVLAARYADVIWELATKIKKTEKREIEFAKIAITNYLQASSDQFTNDIYIKVITLQRAFNLSIAIGLSDQAQIAKELLLKLHSAIHKDLQLGNVFRIFDHLLVQKKLGLSEEETEQFIRDFEVLLGAYSDVNAESFDPHFNKMVSKRLAAYYSKKKLSSEVIRVRTLEAKAFEFVASKGNYSLAASFLGDALQVYKEINMHTEVARVRFELEVAVKKSHSEVATFTHQTTISFEEKAEFQKEVVQTNSLKTMLRIAFGFLPREETQTQRLHKMANESILFSMIPISIMADDHIAAKVNGIEDDLAGRLVMNTAQEVTLQTTWLIWAFEAAIKSHSILPSDFVLLVNRTKLFGEDRTDLLLDGFEAWYAKDQIKATHILIPQIEHALRSLANKLGHATTKEHTKIKGVSTSIGMGDILFDEKIMTSFGEFGADIKLYLLSYYADPRGFNLRNRFAHGLISADQLTEGVTVWLIHTLLVLALIPRPMVSKDD